MEYQELGWGSMNWITVAQDRGRWCAFVNVVLNIQVPLNVGIS